MPNPLDYVLKYGGNPKNMSLGCISCHIVTSLLSHAVATIQTHIPALDMPRCGTRFFPKILPLTPLSPHPIHYEKGVTY